MEQRDDDKCAIDKADEKDEAEQQPSQLALGNLGKIS